MENIIEFICIHATDAYWIMFIMLMLAGLNVPLSEDLILIIGGVISSTCFDNPSDYETIRLYVWIFFGCWFSAWEAYWIGRLLGPKLYTVRWFSRIITPQRIAKLHHYYEKFGIFTFIVGRFLPGGVRNALFLSSGLGRMPFNKFLLRDLFACLLSSSTLFYLGHLFGENYPILLYYFKKYEIFIGIIFLILLTSLIIFLIWKRFKTRSES